MIEHEQYYRKGGTYELPIEIYNDLIEQIKEAQKERNEYKQLYENALKINQNTEKYRTELEDKYVVLQQENEILRKNAEHNDKVVDKARWNEMIYKSRCKKAKEYCGLYTRLSAKDLLNILNGENND